MGNQRLSSNVPASTTALRRILLAMILLAGCDRPQTYVGGTAKPIVDPLVRHVLLIVNDASPDSVEVGRYYAVRRHLKAANVLHIRTAIEEEIDEPGYRSQIEAPIRARIQGASVDYIVMTIGEPIRLKGPQGYSVDAFLAGMDLSLQPIPGMAPNMNLERWKNPYFGATKEFDHAKTGTYIVTRLIGYTVDDCKALVDRSLSASATSGPFLFDEASNRNGPGYSDLQLTLRRAGDLMTQRTYRTLMDRADEFVVPDEPLAGYASWGSNDAKYSHEKYSKLKFLPGALAQTFVSTSARTFKPTRGGQSLIADLITQGVTGVSGYVSEPYSLALARPDIIFERYTRGFNLGESYAAASPLVKWKELVVGDPLCRPYPRR